MILYDFFLIFRINFEFPPTGGIVPDGSFKTVRLLRYITKSDYVLMGKRLKTQFVIQKGVYQCLKIIFFQYVIKYFFFRIGNRSFCIGDIFPNWRSNWDKINGLWIYQKLLELCRLMRDWGKRLISLLSSILARHMKIFYEYYSAQMKLMTFDFRSQLQL